MVSLGIRRRGRRLEEGEKFGELMGLKRVGEGESGKMT